MQTYSFNHRAQQQDACFCPSVVGNCPRCPLLELQTNYLAVQPIHEALIHELIVRLPDFSLCGQENVKLSARRSGARTAAQKTRLPDNGQSLPLER